MRSKHICKIPNSSGRTVNIVSLKIYGSMNLKFSVNFVNKPKSVDIISPKYGDLPSSNSILHSIHNQNERVLRVSISPLDKKPSMENKNVFSLFLATKICWRYLLNWHYNPPFRQIWRLEPSSLVKIESFSSHLHSWFEFQAFKNLICLVPWEPRSKEGLYYEPLHLA